MGRSKAPSLPIKALSFCRPTELRGKGGAVRHQRGGKSHRRWLITVMLFMSYDTESKSRNVLASPLGEEGHEVAKGVQANWIHRGAPRPANPVRRHPAKSVWTVVILIMILDVDVTAEGGIIKLIARRAIPSPSAQRAVKLKNPWAQAHPS